MIVPFLLSAIVHASMRSIENVFVENTNVSESFLTRVCGLSVSGYFTDLLDC